VASGFSRTARVRAAERIAAEVTMRKIFICYRRADAEYAAGALGRELRRHFGEEQVFRDKEDIAGGEAWKQKVLAAIDRDSALLVLIGREWTASGSSGQRRIDDPHDPIRMELHDGLRDGATIIPVLLENAVMPTADELPPDLARLADYNALKLHDTDWQYNLQRIITTLEKAGFTPVAGAGPGGVTSDAPATAPPPPPPGRWNTKAVVAAALVLLTLAGLGAGDLDRDSYLGAAVISLAALILGILAWRETARGRMKGQAVAISATILAGVLLLGSLGNLDTDPAPPDPVVVDEGGGELPPNVDAVEAGGARQASPPIAPTSGAVPAPERRPVSQRPNEARVVADPPVRPADRPAVADIRGRWMDEDGGLFDITQEGNAVHLAGFSDGVQIQGIGTMTGRRLRMTLTMAELLAIQMTLDLSDDGRRLIGKMHGPAGEVDVQLVR
jgi:hypothetical protein